MDIADLLAKLTDIGDYYSLPCISYKLLGKYSYTPKTIFYNGDIPDLQDHNYVILTVFCTKEGLHELCLHYRFLKRFFKSLLTPQAFPLSYNNTLSTAKSMCLVEDRNLMSQCLSNEVL